MFLPKMCRNTDWEINTSYDSDAEREINAKHMKEGAVSL